MDYKKKGTWKNLLIVFSIAIVLIIVLCSIGDIKEIGKVLRNTNFLYILAAFGFLLIYLFLWPLSLHLVVKGHKDEISFIDSLAIGGSEFFFNGITPFSSGGQPFQLYAYNERGIKPSEGTSILLSNFIIYQITVNFFSILSIMLFYNQLDEHLNKIKVFIYVGFGINLLMLVLLILLCTVKTTQRVFNFFLVKLAKNKFLKKIIEPRIPSFNKYVFDSQIAFKKMVKNWPMVILVFLIKIIALSFFYAIPFFAYKAIGVNLTSDNIFYIIAMTSFALTMVIWLPTPGGSGGAELAFSVLFMSLPGVNENISASGMLIWRFMTYYLVMFFGFLAYLIFEKRRKSSPVIDNDKIVNNDSVE